jgi:hypothetical protein
VTALTGLAVSVAGNIGHIQALPGQPVILADRLTAATSPLAAFAGLSVGLLVVKMTPAYSTTGNLDSSARQRSGPTRADRLPALASVPEAVPDRSPGAPPDAGAGLPPVGKTAASRTRPRLAASSRHDLLHEANLIHQAAAANGERISQRALARRLRGHGHRFSNEHLHGIAATIGLFPEKAA